jgi:hypothetical protein
MASRVSTGNDFLEVVMEVQLEIGSRVIRISTEESGFIHAMNKGRALMVEVRWESTGIKQWLPADQVRIWDKIAAPPPKPLTIWGRTTPEYLVSLRYKLAHDPAVLQAREERKKKQKAEKLADTLAGLSDRRKGRSKAKAKRLIRKFEKDPRKPFR